MSRVVQFAKQLREQVATSIFVAGLILMIGCWLSLIVGGVGAAAYAGWITLTEGRDALLAWWSVEHRPLGRFIAGAWMLAFLLGVALTWIGGRISANPKNRVDYSWKGFLRPSIVRPHIELAQLAGIPFSLCFLLLWLILRLDFGWALFGSFLLITALLTLVDKHQFFYLSDPRSPLLVEGGDRFKLQAWFCGECNKNFLPSHWLVQADTNRAPSYVAQCPECKGGNTQVCPQYLEDESEEAEARCKVCRAPPFSAACHRYRDRKAER